MEGRRTTPAEEPAGARRVHSPVLTWLSLAGLLPSIAPLRFTRHRNHSTRYADNITRSTESHTKPISEIPLELCAKTSVPSSSRSKDEASLVVPPVTDIGFAWGIEAACLSDRSPSRRVCESHTDACEGAGLSSCRVGTAEQPLPPLLSPRLGKRACRAPSRPTGKEQETAPQSSPLR